MYDLSKVRIAFIAGMLKQGGCERQLYFMIRNLRDLGCHPDVYTLDQGSYWEEPLKKLGVQVISIMDGGRIAKLKKLKQYIRLGNYDYVHAQHFYTNLYAMAACFLEKPTSIGSLRNDAISEVKGMGFMGWLSILLPQKIVANSYQAKINAKKFLRSKDIYYLPNYVDTDTFSPNKIKKTRDYFKVITVGTVWKPKRIDRVIEIASILKQKQMNSIRFDIIGDGFEMENMIQLAKSKGVLGETLTFKGRSNEMIKEYREADMLLLTSDQEGTPNVVLEAMACALPIIATRVGEIPQIVIDGKTGFSAGKDDIQYMAEMIILLSQNPEKCASMGKLGREYVSINHSQKKLTDSLMEIYTPSKK